MAFVKLFTSIMDSTVWHEPDHTRILWITLLAMADRHGDVSSSIPGLASRAKIPIASVHIALNTFLSPDPYSRTKDFEGRRIEEIDGGWRLLNYEKYRHQQSAEDIREKTAERVRRHRAKKSVTSVTSVTVTKVTPSNDIAEAEAEAVSSIPVISSTQRTEHPIPSRKTRRGPPKEKSLFHPFRTQEHKDAFVEFWDAYWRRVDRAGAEAAYAKHVITPALVRKVLEAVKAQSPGMLAREPGARPQGETWLNHSRWNDEVEEYREMSAVERRIAAL